MEKARVVACIGCIVCLLLLAALYPCDQHAASGWDLLSSPLTKNAQHVATAGWGSHLYVPSRTFESKHVQNMTEWKWLRDGPLLLPRASHLNTAERSVMSRLRAQLSQCTPQRLVVDAGANIGHITLLAAFHNCTTVAFELQLACLDMVRASLRLNNVAAHLVRMAISDQAGKTLQLHRETSCHGGYSTQWKGTDTIVTTTLDTMFPIQFIHLLKIDIEGHELHALFGARQLFASKRIGYVIAEATWWRRYWKNAELETAFTQLANLVYDNGYTLECIRGILRHYPTRVALLNDYTAWMAGVVPMQDGSFEKIIACGEFVIKPTAPI